MKPYLSGWHELRIGFGDRIFDFARFESRPRSTERDLNSYYDEFLERASQISGYFENQDAYKKTLEVVSKLNRAKLIARTPRYPGTTRVMLKTLFSKRGRYSMSPFGDDEKFLDKYTACYRSHLSKENPENGLEGIIEVPNDRTKSETKCSTFHEAAHHLLNNYQFFSKKLFIDENEEFKDKEEMFFAEKLRHEFMVGAVLTDILLEHDKETLFEQRWGMLTSEMYGEHPAMAIAMIGTFTPTLASFFVGLNHDPKFFLALPLPLIIGTTLYEKYKRSKFDKLTASGNRGEFKI